ncbi:MAG: dihydroorotate dehydrogenase electron transfer subunit [Nitrospirae bacterium]|nr:dihydroorotate dehydrogenase electron transfer subunit [Nitrospirota bacterium]
MPRVFTAEIAGNAFLPEKDPVSAEMLSQNAQFKLLTLKPLSEITAPEPGQFYMIQAGTANDPLLKRPFSVYGLQHDCLGFLYRIRGKGTLSLSQLREGDTLQVVGPLGNSYPVPSGDFIAVAGGIGIASLLPFMNKYKKRAYLFYGAMKRDELVMLEEARELSKEAFFTTDDGSYGQKDLITDALRSFLSASQIAHQALRIYACGPAPMLKALSVITNAGGIVCYASLEEHMACGIGACLGCMVKVKIQKPEDRDKNKEWEYKRVCKEGPIFSLEDIKW